MCHDVSRAYKAPRKFNILVAMVPNGDTGLKTVAIWNADGNFTAPQEGRWPPSHPSMQFWALIMGLRLVIFVDNIHQRSPIMTLDEAMCLN